jgi:hypothetical protein
LCDPIYFKGWARMIRKEKTNKNSEKVGKNERKEEKTK